MKIAPTLIIGIGGTGSRIVNRVMEKVVKESPGVEHNLRFAVLDTDANDLEKIRQKNKQIITVQTSVGTTVEECLAASPGVSDWFPAHPALKTKVLTQGAGQVRAVSRLALETCINQGKFNALHDAIRELNELSIDEFSQSMRIIIAGTITGGTGAGLALPLGMHLRHYLNQELRRKDAIIRGFFILPGVMTQIFGLDSPGEAAALNRNAYAVIRELNAYMRKGDGIQMDDFYAMDFTLPSVLGGARETYGEIRPYDYCFLMDSQSESASSLHSREDYEEFAANTIYAQSLSPMSAQSNSSEDNVIQELIRNETQVPGVDKDFTGYVSGGSPRFGAAGSAEIVYPRDEVLNYIAEIQADKSMSEEWLAADYFCEQKHREEIEDDVAEPTPYYKLYSRYYEENNRLDKGIPNDFVGRISEMVKSDGRIQPNGKKSKRFNKVTDYLMALDSKIELEASKSQEVSLGVINCQNAIRNLRQNVPANFAELRKLMRDGDDPGFVKAAQTILGFRSLIKSTAPGDAAVVANQNFSMINLEGRDSSYHPISVASGEDKQYLIENHLQGRRSEEDDDAEAPVAMHPNAIRLFLALLEEQLIRRLDEARSTLEKTNKEIDEMLDRDWNLNVDGRQDIYTAVFQIVEEGVDVGDKIRALVPWIHDGTVATEYSDLQNVAETEGPVNDSGEPVNVGGPDDEGNLGSGNEVVDIINLLEWDYEAVRRFQQAQYRSVIYAESLKYVQAMSEAYKSFYTYLREQIPAMRRDIVSMETSDRYNVSSKESDGVLGQTTRYVCCNKICLRSVSAQITTDASSLRVSGVLCAEIYKRLYQYAYDSSEVNMGSFERSLKNTKGKDSEQRKRDREALEQLERQRSRNAFDQIFNEAVINYWRNFALKRHGDIVDLDIIDAIKQEALYMDNAASEKDQDAHVREVLQSGFSLSKPLLEVNRDEHMRDIKLCMFSESLLGDGEGVAGINVVDERKLNHVKENLLSNNGYADPNLRKGRVLYYQCIYGIRANKLPRFAATLDLEDVKNVDSETGSYFRSYHDAIDTLGPISEKNNIITPHIDKSWHYISAMPELSAAEEFRQKYNIMRAFMYGLVFGKMTRYKAKPRPAYRVRWKTGDVEDLIVRNNTPCDCFYEVFDALNYNPRAVRRLLDECDKSLEGEVASGVTSMGPRKSLLLEHLAISDAYHQLEIALETDTTALLAGDEEHAGKALKTLIEGWRDANGVVAIPHDAKSKRGTRQFTIKEFGADVRSVFDIALLFAWSLPKDVLREDTTSRMIEMCFDIVERYLRKFSTDTELEQNVAMVLYIELMLFIQNLHALKEQPEYVGITNLRVVSQIKAKAFAWFDDESRLIDDNLRTRAREDFGVGSDEDTDV